MAEFDAVWIAQRVTDKSATGIAMAMRALTRSGTLPVGTQLPPVREIAAELGVSPATVANAWSALRKQRILEGHRRNGTRVMNQQNLSIPTRFVSAGTFKEGVLDLRWSRPDVALLPRLDQALAHGAQAEMLNNYSREPILPELELAVRQFWPYEPERFLATNGGYGAIHLIFHALSLGGTTVAIEYPSAARHFDILEDLGAQIVPVAVDNEGPVPASLADALVTKPAAFLFQPRLHSVTGQTVSRPRLAKLAALLSGSETVIIEDDGMAEISGVPSQSLGQFLPEQVVHVHSFSKTLGPDLRLAVLSGPKAIIDQARSYRSFSSGWTSRILQAAAAWLLRDPATADTVQRARRVYNGRRSDLVEALLAQGGRADHGSGFSVWIPVKSEQFATVTLAAHGIAATAGSHFGFGSLHHMRVATSTLPNDRVIDVASALHLAAADPGNTDY